MHWTLIMTIIFFNQHDYIKDRSVIIQPFQSRQQCERAIHHTKQMLRENPLTKLHEMDAKCYKN